MKQVLAIFRKDAVRFWPEILISLAMLAALAIRYPQEWRRPVYSALAFSGPGLLRHTGPFLTTALIVLIPVSWWVLVARVIHVERLVGHTQFWITRPYEWPLLLAAKLLFLAVFLYLPFTIVQCILLSAAGFHPLGYLPGMAFNLLLLTGTMVLPLMALAVVTSNFARMTLTILGVVIFIAGIAALSSSLPTLGGAPDVIGGYVALGFLVAGTGAAVVLQYAKRRARTAWLLLTCAALIMGADALMDPDQALMNHYYASAAGSAAAGMEIHYAAGEMNKPQAHVTDKKSIMEISIPVAVTEIEPGTTATPTAVRASLQTHDGRHWESPWESIYAGHFTGASNAAFRFKMHRADFEHFQNEALHLHLSFAVDEARAVHQIDIPLRDGAFEAGDVGICTPQRPFPGQPINGLGCRSALRQPDLTHVTVQWEGGACSSTGDAAPSSPVNGEGWIGSLDNAPAEFGLTSVWNVPVMLSNATGAWTDGGTYQYHMRQLCPGSPVRFTTYALMARVRVELDVPDFRLPAFSEATLLQFNLN